MASIKNPYRRWCVFVSPVTDWGEGNKNKLNSCP